MSNEDRNNQEEKKLFRIKNTSSYLSLLAVILSIEADYTEFTRINIKESQDYSANLTLIAVYLSTISNFIDLGTALYEFDEIMNNIENEDPLNVSAIKDLLLSRILSVGSVILLLRATYKSIEAGDQGEDDIITPSPGVSI